jgi:hypothetical protein
LPVNFRCADIICDFCGYLAQVRLSCGLNRTRLVTAHGATWSAAVLSQIVLAPLAGLQERRATAFT